MAGASSPSRHLSDATASTSELESTYLRKSNAAEQHAHRGFLQAPAETRLQIDCRCGTTAQCLPPEKCPDFWPANPTSFALCRPD